MRIKQRSINGDDLYLITSICLYSLGHWIGGTIALAVILITAII